MLMTIGEMMTGVGSAIAGLMVAYAMFQNYFPYDLRKPVKLYIRKITNLVYPYMKITFPEYQGNGFNRNKAFAAIERYLNENSSKQAKHLKANVLDDSQVIVLSMADHEEVTDEFQGIKLWWSSNRVTPQTQSISFYPREDANRYFILNFHKKYRDIITNSYLKHVLEEGKAITVKERQRKLYTNSKGESWSRFTRSNWSHVVFEHPATFDTLAMEPKKKEEIIKDLIRFTEAKDYYAKIGKAWKRGYLLHGPPGTGKSTMIAAMANLLKYDVYDLELTAVKDNTELRKLLIDTSSKAILVIEDIDCSLDLTGQREKKKKEKTEEEKKEEKADPVKAEMKKREENDKNSQVTLSGLLNFIDGLWSAACGAERIIVFTTNYVEKLDPALIRRGRMDKHIELTYCCFEAFKVLAKNYLDLESHQLFATICGLLQETKMTPADVAENLMPKSSEEDEEACLARLIKALEEAKAKAEEEVKMKAEEEAKKKVEEEAKAKAEEEEKQKAEKKKDEGEEANGKGVEITGVVKDNGDDAKNSASNANGVKENGDASH
ncbi:AAA-ATPase ASD, mitochondrial-like [Olea europaea subsp. europaea]|uniref:AAA-ATPase ASD, mitochondrial-like n=1 Tax=Olea europaea subsp. europaea TaxID=158383 RepID=A0A8S0TNN1_OLEEU|nr:AAA-ATPase ASD, mitochondrial-like [Olea europaea subsp. europaea]